MIYELLHCPTLSAPGPPVSLLYLCCPNALPSRFFEPQTLFLGGGSHCGATSVHTGRDSAAAERRPAPPWVPCRQQQRSVPQVEEESPTFRYHEPQRTSIVHFQVRSETTQKDSWKLTIFLFLSVFLLRESLLRFMPSACIVIGNIEVSLDWSKHSN